MSTLAAAETANNTQSRSDQPLLRFENVFKQFGGHRLSRTDRSLVAIARALAANAELLVLDEPTSSLPASDLYVADTSAAFDPKGNHHIMAFDVGDGRRVQNGRLFAVINPGLADGFRVDMYGNIFTSSADSVQIYTNDGDAAG
jgi:alpha-D-ribose 1-methylphosphonate 5-triphosphate synthase subunit PhnL